MKVATRNLLGALCVEALDRPIVAAALHCLAVYGQTGEAPRPLPADRFLLPAPVAERGEVQRVLRRLPLLAWDAQGTGAHVAVAPAFLPEWAAVVEKLTQYDGVLEAWVPDGTAPALTTALRKGALLFNAQLFFEVHEVLEAQWLKETGAVKRFVQGLIQVAVAFYHLGHHNLRGTLSLLQDGLDKIAPYRPAFVGIELADFVAGLEACRAALLRLGPERLEQFRTEQIPRLQFVCEKES